MGSLSAAERKVARTFLAAYPIAGLETLAQLAERAGVSAPTVMRFVNRLGFVGYPEFQQALHREIQEQLTSALLQYDEQPMSPEDDALGHSVNVFQEEIGRTFAAVPASEFRAVVELLADRRREVFCAGGRFSQILAFYLFAHLNMMRPGCRHVAVVPTSGWDELVDVGRRTVLVVFDYRRYQNATIEYAERAAEKGAHIVLFTDPWLSPVAAVARHVLTSTLGAPSPFDSLVPAIALVEAVIAGLAAHIGQDARPRIEELERLRAGMTWGELEIGVGDGASALRA
jgi:DNA-binding MurR/RpiR family transcriptional regulator